MIKFKVNNWLIVVDNGSFQKETIEFLDFIIAGGYQDPRIKAVKMNSDYGFSSIGTNYALQFIS
jgi:hypothetical protein